jgi:DNA-binding transcriptional regulator YiaG
LEQRQVAKRLGVSLATYRSWEVNRRKPMVKNMARAIKFLGYDWRPTPVTFGERVRHHRTAAGLSLRQLARILGTHPDTIRAWETGEHKPSQSLRSKLENWISSAII